MAFGVDGDADGFAEMEVGGELEKVGNGTVTDFGDRWLLSEKRAGEEKENCEKGASHGLPPESTNVRASGQTIHLGYGEAKG
jgi:hypothetical protein